MRNSGSRVSHREPLLALNLAIEYAILAAVKIPNTQRTLTMRCETSAPYKVSQRPPPNRR